MRTLSVIAMLWAPLALAAPPTAHTCPADTTARSAQDGDRKTQWCEGADGLRRGPWIEWHGNGKAAAQVGYVDGRREGAFAAWYPDGSQRAEGQYAGGQRTGTWTLYDGEGWRRRGAIEAERFSGPWTVSDRDGRVRAAGPYVNGARDGRWTWTDPKGVAHHGSYDAGRFLMCDGDCPLLQPQLEIEEAVKGIEPQTRACYRKATKDQPTLAGDVELHWQVDASGGTGDVKVAGGSLPVGPLTACLVDTISTLRLPPPGRAVPAKRVFRFRPKSGFTDELSTEGRCQAKALRPHLNPARAALLRCIKASVPWPPPTGGAVALRWAITESGAVGPVGVTPDDLPQRVSCLAKQVQALSFPAGHPCNVGYTIRWE